MKKKFFITILLVLSLAFSVNSYAKRSTLNPMSPRVLEESKYNQDYSYGFSILAGNGIDSLEYVNRLIGWNLNYYVFDKYILRPVAHSYALLPNGVQNSVGNFFGNIGDLNYSVNNLFLLRPYDSFTSFSRLVINSTFGVLGIFDVASVMGIEKKEMPMRTVFGIYGMDNGAYLMVPVYGPTTTRDIQGDTIDNWQYYFFPWYIGIGAWAIEGIHNRAQLVEQESLVDNAIDPYIQTREIYLMYNQGLTGKDSTQDDAKFEESLDEEFLDEIDG